ncbi:MAG: transcription antitermination factor NusB [Bacteroidetes bacterium]|nr:transcription antitermination factor NusB [Bacteroidota bacterium]
MQALYAYFKQDNADIAFYEKELFKSLDKIYDLYITILALYADIHHTAHLVIEENKNKLLPGPDDLDPNLKFIQNSLLKGISESTELKKEIHNRKISWQNDLDLVRKLFSEIRQSELYKTYMATPGSSVKEEKEFLITLTGEYLAEHELLNHLFEERNIHWTDDMYVAFTMVMRTFEAYTGEFKLLPLYKDPEDDKKFAATIFRQTILHNDEFEKLIDAKTKNWELERIAAMDVLLMKMALTEFLNVSNVPVKVSLNEYIDISKEYSTPNSRTFINGVLDKIIVDLRNENRIQKTGRGLLES